MAHGVELELPPLLPGEAGRSLFFWSSTYARYYNPYEDAVLQTLRFLRAIYGFAIVDYNYRDLGLYMGLADRLFGLANRGAHLACCVLTSSEYGTPAMPDLVRAAEDLLEQISSITNSH